MNLQKSMDQDRLFRAMECSYRRLSPFRDLTAGLVREYAGSGYGGEPNHEILANLMNQAVDAYTMCLAANRPRVLITAEQMGLEYFAKQFQVAINNLIREIQLETTLRAAVLDAFFCVGVVKVYRANSVPVMVEEGVWMDPGLPYVANVSLDNFCYDTGSPEWSKIRYSADCYRIPFDDLKNAVFDQSLVRDLAPTSKGQADSTRLERISTGWDTDDDEVEPMIDLMDVWIPRERKIYTFPMDPVNRFRGKGPAVAVMDWDEPEDGPHKILSFNDVPQNIMPTSPAAQLSGLSRLTNNLLRKERRQAMRQKDVHTYTPADVKGAERAKRANDGDSVCVQDPKEQQVMKFGGVDSGNHAFMLGCVEMFDRMAGNLTAMMGLGPQADTLGQEELIHGAVSKKEAQMQYRVIDFARNIIHDLGYMLWHDVAKTIPGRIDIPGADGYSVDATWTPDDREGDFYDYNFDLDVYSMPYQSPAQRLQAINQLVTQIYAPLLPMLQQQGGQLNLQKLTEIYAEFLNEPRIRELVQFAALNEMPPAGGEPDATIPAQTTRNYVRRNVATGGTPQNRLRVAQSEWLNRTGQNNQDQQAMTGA